MTDARDTHAAQGLTPVVGALRRLRSRARALLLAQRALFIGVLLLGAGVSLVGLDYLLRFPSWIRWFHLALGASSGVFLGVRLLGPALRFRPSLTSVALRLERDNPRLAGSLASAVEFSRDPSSPDSPTALALERAVIGAAADRFKGVRAGALLRPRALTRRALQLGALAALVVSALALKPDLTRIGATRLLAPWAGAQWPKRTGIADATAIAVHPRGAALPLRAGVTRSHRDLDTTYAAAQYRLLGADGRAVSPVRTALLTHQRRDVALPGGASGARVEGRVGADAPVVL